MDILDMLNPGPVNAPNMNLDDSEEEIECDDNQNRMVVAEEIMSGSDTEEEIPEMIPADSVRLPAPPRFQPFRHNAPEHIRCTHLPEGFPVNSIGSGLCPLSFFELFFTEKVYEELARNTNAYAASKRAGQGQGRPWKPTSTPELMIFFGIIIYMGVYKVMRGPLYWNQNHEFPQHQITRYMSQTRFEQLKQYFHIPPVNLQPRLEESDWTRKLQPLASILQGLFQRYLTPASNVSVDEMMIRFTGRSKHTVTMRAKPIPKGYKMIALCQQGYTYSFMFTSRLNSFTDLDRTLYNGSQSLSTTSYAVFQLAHYLPSTTHRFVLYCDNYFTNIPLFIALRENLQIAACGTVRPNSASYPTEFKIDKRWVSLPFNTLSAIICKDLVLAVLWQDKNLVRILTTYHQCTPEPQNFQYRVRRRPIVNSENRELVMAGWGNATSQVLRITYAFCQL